MGGGGCIFIYSGSARLVSFEIKLISKEVIQAEPEYTNKHSSDGPVPVGQPKEHKLGLPSPVYVLDLSIQVLINLQECTLKLYIVLLFSYLISKS